MTDPIRYVLTVRVYFGFIASYKGVTGEILVFETVQSGPSCFL